MIAVASARPEAIAEPQQESQVGPLQGFGDIQVHPGQQRRVENRVPTGFYYHVQTYDTAEPRQQQQQVQHPIEPLRLPAAASAEQPQIVSYPAVPRAPVYLPYRHHNPYFYNYNPYYHHNGYLPASTAALPYYNGAFGLGYPYHHGGFPYAYYPAAAATAAAGHQE